MAYVDTPTGQVGNNPWDGYKAVPSSNGNSGDTGLAISTNYICFDTSKFDSLTEAQTVAATGSCKQIIYAFVKEMYDWYTAEAAADKPTKLTLSQNSFSDASSGTSMVMRHELTTFHAATTTVTAG